MSKNRQQETLIARGLFAPTTLNEGNRTVEVTWGSERSVKRYDWRRGRDFNEVLDFSASSVRMERLLSGAPLLDSHNSWGGVTRSVLGVVEKASVDGKKGVATIRFADTEEGLKAFQMVKDGILRNISVGYAVNKYDIEEPAENSRELPVYRAVDWEPYEVSLVSIPADPTAQVRGLGSDPENQPNSNMDPLQTTGTEPNAQRGADPANPNTAPAGGGAAAPVGDGGQSAATRGAEPQTPPVNIEEAVQRAMAQQQKLTADIVGLVRGVGLPSDFATDLLAKPGMTLDNARAAVLDALAKQDNGFNPVKTSVGQEGDEKFRTAVIDGIALRSGIQVSHLGMDATAQRNAREFQTLPVVELARMCLERAGERNLGYDRENILKRAITSNSTDFPVLLEGTNRRVLLAAYQAEPFDWNVWCSTGSVGDFRKYERVRMHDSFNRLAPIEENGEYETFAINDGEKESVQVFSYGKKFNLTRKMLINDDLNTFLRLIAMFGRAAQRSIQIDAYSKLVSNSGLGPILGDGKTLFHADHGNIATTPGTFSIDVWDKMRIQMATQKPYGGKVDDFLNYRPEILLCSIHQGMAAKLLNNSEFDPFSASRDRKPNPVRGMFSNILDTPWLSGAAYYGFVSPNTDPVMEVSFLNGIQEPFMDQRIAWETDGIEYKCRHEYGIHGVGYKGAIYNSGVNP